MTPLLALSWLLVAAPGELDDEAIADMQKTSAAGAIIGSVVAGGVAGGVALGAVTLLTPTGAMDNYAVEDIALVVGGTTAVATFVGAGLGAVVGADGRSATPGIVSSLLSMLGAVPGVACFAYGVAIAGTSTVTGPCLCIMGGCVALPAIGGAALGAVGGVNMIEPPKPDVPPAPSEWPSGRRRATLPPLLDPTSAPGDVVKDPIDEKTDPNDVVDPADDPLPVLF